MEFSGVEKIIEENDEDGGWVTHEGDAEADGGSESTEMVSHEMTLDSNKLDEIRGEIATLNFDDEDDDEGEAFDMEEFEESGMLDKVDPSVVIKPAPVVVEKNATENGPEVDSVLRTRTYDLHITYNKYYQTPHLFLIGYDENRKPLSVEEMFEDVSQDNAKKTVTIETHPHLGPSMASIHPCKHGDLMKKFIQIAEDGGNELSVHSYLIIFLKFVQSVIPTINYDYSRNITL
jgi:ubiquitin-like-conjugating enzyme ATG3